MARDHLLQLLKTLNKKERRNFATQNNVTKRNRVAYFSELYHKYIFLIDQNFDDDKIEVEINRFLIRKPAIKKDIGNIRKQLKDKVLLSITSTQLIENNKSKMLFYINTINLFLRRRLFDEAELAITQAKNFARLNDYNNALIEITDLHLYLLGRLSGKRDLELQEKLIKELTLHHSLYGIELTLRNIFRKLILIAQNDYQLKKEENKAAFHKAYKKFDFDNFPIAEHKKKKHTHIVNWYYRSKNLYNRATGNLYEAFEDGKSLIEYFESNETLITHFKPSYIKSICSITRVCSELSNHNELEKNLYKVKSFYENANNYTALEATCDIGVLHYLYTYQYKKAIDLANFIEKEWNTIAAKTIDGKLLWYCHSNLLLFWIANEETKFLYWLYKGLNIPRSNKGKAYYFGIRMFELINDFEEKNWHTCLQKIEALQKTLDNNENLSAFERIVLSNFRKLYNVYNSNKNINLSKNEIKTLKIKTFQQLKDALQNEKLKNLPINYKEVITWCESHLQNKTIKEVFEAEH